MNEIIDIPVPEGIDLPRLRLIFGAGELTLAPGDSDALLSGEVRYADERLKPVFTVEGGTVTVRNGIGDDILGDLKALWENRERFENVWNLRVGAIPLDMFLRVGAARTGINLGGLTIRNLTVEQGATDLSIEFSEPNREPMESFSFTGGASRCLLRGLGNTRTRRIAFRGGAGDYTLEFSGAAPEGMDVTVEAGVGRVVLAVPREVRAVLTRKGGLTAVSSSGAWAQNEGRWYNGDPGTAPDASEPPLRFTVTMGLGALELRNA